MSKRWCFTIFNYSNVELQDLKTYGERIIFQEERTKTEKAHIQGYVEFDKNVTFEQIKTRLPAGAHFSEARESKESNEIYCSKVRSRIKFTDTYCRGLTKRKATKQGNRSDLSEIKRKLDSGCSIRTIADAHFGDYIRYHQGLEKYRRLLQEPRKKAPTVIIIWGPPGTGKSYAAREMSPNAFWVPQQHGDNLWFDGYTGQRTVIWDEFAGSCQWNLLLRLCDEYPLKVQVKHGFEEMVADKVIFTSNTQWEEWYNFEENPKFIKRAFERRITEIKHFLTKYY